MGATRVVTAIVALIVTVCLVLTVARTAAAAGSDERRAAKDAALVEELRKKNPEAAETFREANDASYANDLPRAVALYEKVSAAVPEFTPALRRRGILLVEMGKRGEGLALARKALSLEDTPANEANLALALIHPENGNPAGSRDAAEALSLAHRVVAKDPNNVDHLQTLCIVAISAQAVQDLQSCADGLVRFAPNEPESYVFATVAAAARGDRDAAYASIATARGLGLAPESADRLRVMVEQSEPPIYRWGKRLLVVFGAWLAGLGLLFVAGAALSGATLRFVRRLSPDPVARQEGSTLRGVYRALLHVASFYYYASLPLVLLLAVLLGAGVILGFLWVGHIPLYFVAVILSIVVYTVVSVVKSLFARAKDLDPGLAVDLEKHHRLARVIDEVAKRVGTRRVDEVYLTPGTDLAVLERGGFVRQMRGTTERCLVLGVGVLDGMKLGPFKAILAHEYGHFSNRDTAGGKVALSVRRSLELTAIRLAQGGAAKPYNPAWLFLVVFHKIFLRISQGASRLQEVMADRIAAFTYGPDAFERGLSHVVRRDIAFAAHVKVSIREVVENARPLPNLYRYEPETKSETLDVDEAYEKEFDREPSPYDSHPKPADRVRWVRELTAKVTSAGDEESDAWDLFASRVELEQILTTEYRTRLARRGISVAAAEEASAAA